MDELTDTECACALRLDYTQNFSQLVKAGKYSKVVADVSEKNFPTKPGATDISCKLIQAGHLIRGDTAQDALNREGLRAATAYELLAFHLSPLGQSLTFPIVALGSIWHNPITIDHVVDVWGTANERKLYCHIYHERWLGHCRFLGVKYPR